MADEVDMSQLAIALDNAEALARVTNRASGQGPDWIDGVPCCRECGEPIPARRLAALPGVGLCVLCQRVHEEGAADG